MRELVRGIFPKVIPIGKGFRSPSPRRRLSPDPDSANGCRVRDDYWKFIGLRQGCHDYDDPTGIDPEGVEEPPETVSPCLAAGYTAFLAPLSCVEEPGERLVTRDVIIKEERTYALAIREKTGTKGKEEAGPLAG